MSFSSRHRYKSRREKNQNVAKKSKMIIISILIVLAVFLIKNRVSIFDYLKTYFY